MSWMRSLTLVVDVTSNTWKDRKRIAGPPAPVLTLMSVTQSPGACVHTSSASFGNCTLCKIWVLFSWIAFTSTRCGWSFLGSSLHKHSKHPLKTTAHYGHSFISFFHIKMNTQGGPDDHRRQRRTFLISNICACGAACLWHIIQHTGLTSVSSASASDSLRRGALCGVTPQIAERASEETDWVERGHSRATAAAIRALCWAWWMRQHTETYLRYVIIWWSWMLLLDEANSCTPKHRTMSSFHLHCLFYLSCPVFH